jgi:hypothetical protein
MHLAAVHEPILCMEVLIVMASIRNAKRIIRCVEQGIDTSARLGSTVSTGVCP